eukprot:scaffold1299_cov246-Pinguiococcus_pyrenoidosus.AAC.20
MILKGCSESSKDVLGGPRATIMIAKLIPGFDRGSNFRGLVRVLRKWCKKRGIYSNKAGFLGGININILSTLVCQMYPMATTSTLVRKFFFLFHRWNWQNPVLLCRPVEHTELTWPNWSSERDLMPIITPNYPTINSTYNVNKWTLKVMREEFVRGRQIVEQAAREAGLLEVSAESLPPDELEQAEATVMECWDRLVEPSDFPAVYERYLILNIQANTVDDYNSWKGYIESRLRLLVQHHRAPCLGQLPFSSIRAWPKEFDFRVQKGKPNRAAETVVVYEEEQDKNAAGKKGNEAAEESAKPENRVCGCYMIGLNVDKRRKRKLINLDGVLESWKKGLGVDVIGNPLPWVREGMTIDFDAYSFKELPDVVMEPLGGRSAASQIRRLSKRKQHEEEKEAALRDLERKKQEQEELEKEKAAAAEVGALEEARFGATSDEAMDEGAASLKRERDIDEDLDAQERKRARRDAGPEERDGVSLEVSVKEVAADGTVLEHPFRAQFPSCLAFHPRRGTPAAELLRSDGNGLVAGTSAAAGFGAGGWIMTSAAQAAFERVVENAAADGGAEETKATMAEEARAEEARAEEARAEEARAEEGKAEEAREGDSSRDDAAVAGGPKRQSPESVIQVVEEEKVRKAMAERLRTALSLGRMSMADIIRGGNFDWNGERVVHRINTNA